MGRCFMLMSFERSWKVSSRGIRDGEREACEELIEMVGEGRGD